MNKLPTNQVADQTNRQTTEQTAKQASNQATIQPARQGKPRVQQIISTASIEGLLASCFMCLICHRLATPPPSSHSPPEEDKLIYKFSFIYHTSLPLLYVPLFFFFFYVCRYFLLGIMEETEKMNRSQDFWGGGRVGDKVLQRRREILHN